MKNEKQISYVLRIKSLSLKNVKTIYIEKKYFEYVHK